MSITIIVSALLAGGFGFFKYKAVKSQDIIPKVGIVNEKLILCGEKPNCVCSFNTDEEHKIDAIQTNRSISEVISKLEKELSLKIITKNENYVHFTFTSSIMGYVDDIEVYQSSGALQVRSISRVGYSDMGANRKRIELIRSLLDN